MRGLHLPSSAWYSPSIRWCRWTVDSATRWMETRSWYTRCLRWLSPLAPRSTLSPSSVAKIWSAWEISAADREVARWYERSGDSAYALRILLSLCCCVRIMSWDGTAELHICQRFLLFWKMHGHGQTLAISEMMVGRRSYGENWKRLVIAWP